MCSILMTQLLVAGCSLQRSAPSKSCNENAKLVLGRGILSSPVIGPPWNAGFLKQVAEASVACSRGGVLADAGSRKPMFKTHALTLWTLRATPANAWTPLQAPGVPRVRRKGFRRSTRQMTCGVGRAWRGHRQGLGVRGRAAAQSQSPAARRRETLRPPLACCSQRRARATTRAALQPPERLCEGAHGSPGGSRVAEQRGLAGQEAGACSSRR